MAIKPVSVSQLNSYIKRILGTDPILMNVSVKGEISNLTKHSSGHWYFALKDEGSKINCFLPSNRVSSLRFELSEGMEITAYGSISVYEKGGYYSLNIRDIDIEGEGALKAAFENLKNKLSSEGLFDISHKKTLPVFPKNIGVVTSPTGAAVRDIITTVRRRNPMVNILVYPCQVQGEGSAESVCRGISYFNEQKPETDILIVGRGGGSAEDLWTFNEESVARAIYKSNIPVISAVGHEVDYLISDYVADVRGATPTAAAELAVPHIDNLKDRVRRGAPENLYPILAGKVRTMEIRIQALRNEADFSTKSMLSVLENRLALLKSELSISDPMAVLQRGYAIVKDKEGRWIMSSKDIKPGDKLEIVMKDGKICCAAAEVQDV